MRDLIYQARLVRVFEEKDKSEKIHYGYFAEVQVRSSEPASNGIGYTYTSKVPINFEQFGDLEKKLKEIEGPIIFNLTLNFQ